VDERATSEIRESEVVMPIRNYTYGAKPPHVNTDRVSDQIRLAHRYRNSLVEIERWRREQISEIQNKFIPGLAAAQAKIDLTRSALLNHLDLISARNAEAKSRTGTKDDRERTAILRADIRVACEEAKVLKSVEKSDEFIAAMKSLNDEFNEKWRVVRGASGVYYGTYWSVEQNARASFSRSVSPPKFMKWEGHGCVSMNFSPALPIEDALGGKSNKLRIEVSPDNPKFAVAYLRIGSDEGDNRVPVWTACRVRLHRPVPAGSSISWAYISRERIGLTDHWELRLTIDIPEESMPVKVMAGNGTCGVDVGWRMVKDGLRVAVWAGSDGNSGELIIPQCRIKQMEIPENLASRRDISFNEIRAAFSEWLETNRTSIPPWLAEVTEHIGQWKSPGRLAFVVVKWRDNRFAGDAAIFDVLESWRKQDKHLANWQGHARSLDWRKEMYRQFAVMLRKRYAKIIVEDIDWRKLARKAESDQEEDMQTRWYSRLASVGLLCEILRSMTGAEKRKAANTTTDCYLCGHRNNWDHRELMHTCEGCGETWDQDHCAAKNILASADVVKEDQVSLANNATKGVARRITASEWRSRSREKRAARKVESSAMKGNEL
jgi:hypothetical protein